MPLKFEEPSGLDNDPTKQDVQVVEFQKTSKVFDFLKLITEGNLQRMFAREEDKVKIAFGYDEEIVFMFKRGSAFNVSDFFALYPEGRQRNNAIILRPGFELVKINRETSTSDLSVCFYHNDCGAIYISSFSILRTGPERHKVKGE